MKIKVVTRKYVEVLENSLFTRAVSSTVPVTAVPGTIQVLLYLKKYLVLLTRYFVPCTDPGYKVHCTWFKSTWYLIRYSVPGTWVRYFVPVKNRYNQVQVKSFLRYFYNLMKTIK